MNKIENRGTPVSKQGRAALRQEGGDNRGAIFAPVAGHAAAERRAQLLSCAKGARDAGLRVVTMAYDEVPHSLAELQSPKFQELARRLKSGEFEAIIATMPNGGFMMFGGPGQRGSDQ